MTRASSFRERVAGSALATYIMVFFLFFWTLPESWADRGDAMMSLFALGAFVHNGSARRWKRHTARPSLTNASN
jgi:hypothetical protein